MKNQILVNKDILECLVSWVIQTEEKDYLLWLENEEIDEESKQAKMHPYRLALELSDSMDGSSK